MLTGDFRPLEYDPNIPDPVGWRYSNSPKYGCRVVINDEYTIYNVEYCYSVVAGLTDDIARRDLIEGFVYIIKNHIDREINGNEVQQLYDLFSAYEYPFRDLSAELSYSTLPKINIDLGDRDDFLAFIKQLKQKDALPVMPTESELLRFLNGGEPAND